MNQITQQQLRNVVIDGEFPSEIVFVKGLPLKFTFTDKDITQCTSLEECFKIFTDVVECVGGVDFAALPSVYFYPIQNAYMAFQLSTGAALLEAVEKFVESSESRGWWEVYKCSTPAHVLTIKGQLNIVQRRWIMLNTIEDSKDRISLISDLFTALKPWLDKDLFIKLQEHKDVTRENAFFDDSTQDTLLREKAKKIAADRKLPQESEGDIIVIEDGKE